MPRIWTLVALALSACAPAVLSIPGDPLIQDQMTLMHDFEAWFGGFEARLADPSPEVARECASEAVFVLRNPDLWSAPEMAPSVVERERFLQLARWEGLRAVGGLPKDMRALAALAEIDAIAGDREGGAWARCRAADVADQSFSAQAACASALAVAGHESLAMELWMRTFPLADRDGQRFYVLHELEQEGNGNFVVSFPADVVARYRALIEARSAPPPPPKIEAPDHPEGPSWPPPRQAVRPADGSVDPATRLGGGINSSADSP
jgi:hypothetical protein